jgi:hypothetical protein
MAVVRCDPNVVGGGDDGTTWEDAFADFQDASDDATSGDEIWVKEGTFTLSSAVTLKDGVDTYGGFDSALTGTGGSVAGRDLVNDITIVDGNDTVRCFIGADCRLDGFTIQDGYRTTMHGAGIYCSGDDLDLHKCVIKNCDLSGAYYGGGVYLSGTGSLDCEDCTIDNCTGYTGGGIYATVATVNVKNCIIKNNDAYTYIGGGIRVGSSVTLLVENCYFYNNSSDDGGTIAHSGSNLTVKLCEFDSNWTHASTWSNGSAIFSNGGVVENCLFHDEDPDWKGAIRENSTNTLTIKNSDFADITGGTSTCAAISATATSVVVLYNCIIWGNTPTSTPLEPTGAFSVYNSDVQGGWTGTGSDNINDDPDFIGSGDDPYNIVAGSPCIDAGHGDYAPTTDYLGNPRYDDPATSNTGSGTPVYTDMGAYEYQGVPGWAHKIHNIANANISKINGISKANITKVNNV